MLKPAIRALSHTPWYAALSVGVIALSMALATTTFLIVDGVLFKRLPFERPDELYVARGSWLRQPSLRVAVSAKDYRDWSAANPELQVAAIGLGGLGGRIGHWRASLRGKEASCTKQRYSAHGVPRRSRNVTSATGRRRFRPYFRVG